MFVMPKRVRVVVVVATLACAAGLLMLALMAKPTQAQAQNDTTNERIPFANNSFDPCLGEEFLSRVLCTSLATLHARCKRWAPFQGPRQLAGARRERCQRCQVRPPQLG